MPNIIKKASVKQATFVRCMCFELYTISKFVYKT